MRILIILLLYININSTVAQNTILEDTIFENISFKLNELKLIDPSFFYKLDSLSYANECPIFSDKKNELFSIYIDSSFFYKLDLSYYVKRYPMLSDKKKECSSMHIEENKGDSILISIFKDESMYNTYKDIGFIEANDKTFFVRGDYIQDIFQVNKKRLKIFNYKKIIGTKHERGILPLITESLDGKTEWTFLYLKGNIMLLEYAYTDN